MTLHKTACMAALLLAASVFAPEAEARTWYYLACNATPTTGNVWSDFFASSTYGETANTTAFVSYNYGTNFVYDTYSASNTKLQSSRCVDFFTSQANSFATSFLQSHPQYNRAEWHYSGTAVVIECSGDAPNSGATDICHTFNSTGLTGAGTITVSGSGAICSQWDPCDVDGPGPFHNEK